MKHLDGLVSWTGSLMANKDERADSIIFGGILSIVGMITWQGWDTVANHQEFSPMNFGLGCAAILGAIGGGKAMRDGWGKKEEEKTDGPAA